MANEKTVKPSNQEKAFFIKQLFLKKHDFDVETPLYLLDNAWKPDAKLDLDVGHAKLSDDDYAVEIQLKIHVKIEKKSIFSMTVIYGGVFQMKGYNDDEMKRLINSFCPNFIPLCKASGISDDHSSWIPAIESISCRL